MTPRIIRSRELVDDFIKAGFQKKDYTAKKNARSRMARLHGINAY